MSQDGEKMKIVKKGIKEKRKNWKKRNNGGGLIVHNLPRAPGVYGYHTFNRQPAPPAPAGFSINIHLVIRSFSGEDDFVWQYQAFTLT